MAIGLVFLGLSTATLVTLSNMNALTVVQRWGQEEFPGQDITSLIAKMQSWVIVAIGGAEMIGCVFGALIYDKMDFKSQTDLFFVTVLVSFVSNRIILRDNGGSKRFRKRNVLQEETAEKDSDDYIRIK